jgi:hypothetical protein
MKIIETDINDITNDINKSKLNISNEMLGYTQLIFNEDYNKEIEEINKLKSSISEKKLKIKEDKIELENLFIEYRKKNKENSFLNKIGKLVFTGLIQESMKMEMIVLLKSFNTMSEERINNYLNETIRLLSQKFAKT